MDTRLAVLGLMDAGSGYGYELKHSWDQWFGAMKPLAFGQVYGVLARLLRDGLIATVGSEPGAGPERKRYRLTEQGREALSAWMFEPERADRAVRAELFAKTVIALMLDADAERLLDLQRAAHTARMRELTRAKRDADLCTVLLADHALFHIEADLRWIELTSARLAELRTQVRGEA